MRGLRQDSNDDAAVLGPAGPRGVGRDRLVLAVADHVDLVQWHPALRVEILTVSARESQLLVVGGSRRCRVTFDLDENALRIGLQLSDHLVETSLGLSGNVASPNVKSPSSSLSVTS